MRTLARRTTQNHLAAIAIAFVALVAGSCASSRSQVQNTTRTDASDARSQSSVPIPIYRGNVTADGWFPFNTDPTNGQGHRFSRFVDLVRAIDAANLGSPGKFDVFDTSEVDPNFSLYYDGVATFFAVGQDLTVEERAGFWSLAGARVSLMCS